MITTVKFGNLYLGNKMSGVPFFNAPWFYDMTVRLCAVPGVSSVFNPANEDAQRGFDPMKCPSGSKEEAEAAGFVLRDALGADWKYISEHSDGLVIGPDWRTSKGTISEIACHQALGLPVWEWDLFLDFGTSGWESVRQLLEETDNQFPPLGNYLI